MFYFLLILWIIALIYLQIRDNKADAESIDPTVETVTTPTPRQDTFDRFVRLYVFIFIIYLLFKIAYFLIRFFGNVQFE